MSKTSRPPPLPLPTRAGLSHMAQHIEEEGFVPSRALELATQGSFGVGMGAGDVESEATQHGEIGRCIVLATARQVFVEQHIERPMQAVFDAPMLPHDAQHFRRPVMARQQEIALGMGAIALALDIWATACRPAKLCRFAMSPAGATTATLVSSRP